MSTAKDFPGKNVDRVEQPEENYRATLNIIEDLDEERLKSAGTQTALLNMLEDFDEERAKGADTQTALVNMLEDIEDSRLRAEETRANLAQVNKELEGFSYSVSHDLRAPLRAISGFAQALREDEGDRLDADGLRYLDLIQDNAHRMGQLIDDLLAFSRLGRQQMVEDIVDLDVLARSVFSDLAQQEKGREIEFVESGSPTARGDAAMLRQVLQNLIGNAIKFTRTKDRTRVEFGYDPEQGGGAYYVRDNGVGFDMQYANKLFGVFQRLHSAKEFEGTGVGLALVNRIVARHGGRTWAVGKVDEGATFFFTLPGRRSE
ncbi:MAG TPA: ATP-binding protein [Methanomassiliicoccales archaeon]|nr:ATP-binding protein [Methanomassiliicoccales archaeon]